MNLNKTNDFYELVISEENAGSRIDKLLSSFPEIASRSRALFLIEAGFVTLNGKVIKASHKTKAGDMFKIYIPTEKKETTLTPYDFKLNVLHEDDDIIVLNKPAGLVVHPAAGHYDKTLVNALIHHTKNLSMGFHEHRPGIVHRLDKETSGLLVVCKNDHSQNILAQQFKNRTIHRIYWALAYGTPSRPSGTIESQLGRHPTNRKKFASVKTGGKKAITHYKLIKQAQALVHFELKLETGRTHQIRVHLSEMGRPIVGDSLYGADKKINLVSSPELKDYIKNMTRIGLHAKDLGFIHPVTKKEMFFSSDWPDDLKKIVGLCGF